MEKQENVCRLCLEHCANKFKFIEENVTEILGILLKSTSPISEDVVICANCTESYEECSNFKSKCLDVQDCIVQFNKCMDSNAKLDLKDIYLSKEAKYLPEGHDICRLCMGLFKMSSFISLDGEEGGIMLEKMIEKCLPELDLRVTERPAICADCHKSVQSYFDLISNCLSVEEKIGKYCEATGKSCRDPIKLKDVLEFLTRNIFDKVDGINIETKFYGDEEHPYEQKCNKELLCISKNVPTIKEEVEQVDRIKTEEIFLQEMELKFEPKPAYLIKREEQEFNNVLKQEIDDQLDDVELKRLECQDGIIKLDVKQENLDSIQDGDIFLKTETNVNLPEEEKCSMMQPLRPLSHVQVSTTRRTLHQCELCSYQSRFKSKIRRHSVIHKNPSEVTMYQCEQCSFKTKYKCDLKRHLLTHESFSEATTHLCGQCSFQTKHKGYLKRHLLSHKNPSEITMYQCEHCSFQTKYKYPLKRHLLVHKNPSELIMYKCELCSFQTKHKHHVKRHMSIHKNTFPLPISKKAQCE